MAVARTDNLHVLWGLLVLAGLGIGGIVVPASIITTIICPDVSCPLHSLPQPWLVICSLRRLLSVVTVMENDVNIHPNLPS